MSRFPQWYPTGTHGVVQFPLGWDRMKLGGVSLPCRANLTMGGLSLQVDSKSKKGATAPTPTVHGLEPASFAARLVVWTQEQMDEVDELLPRLWSLTEPTPVTLDHPQVYSLQRLLGKVDVLIKSISIWTPSSVIRGGWELTLGMAHWPAAQKAAKSATSKTPKKPKAVTPPGLAAQQKQAALNQAPIEAPAYFGYVP